LKLAKERVILKVQCNVALGLLIFPLFPILMVASAESELLRTSNKETISDIIPNLRGDDIQPNRKILQRATLKIDFYLIPIMGMFCVSLASNVTSESQCSSPAQTFCHSW
jgi:hypothetical protein